MRNAPRWALIVCVALGGLASLTPLPAQEAETTNDETARRRGRTRSPARVLDVSPKNTATIEGQEAKATAGWIVLHDVIRFIEMSTGKPVLFESISRDPNYSEEAQLRLLSDQKNFSVEIAIAILTANHYELVETKLPDGTAVLWLSSQRSRQGAAAILPEPALVLGPDDPLPEGNGLVLATCVRSLEHADPMVVTQVLRDYMSIQVSGRRRVIPVAGSDQVVITASVDQLRTAIALIEMIDVPSARPTKPKSEPDDSGKEKN